MVFVTHFYFRRAHAGEQLAFRMWGYPYSSLSGAGLMAAILLSTAFTAEFRMTLVYGLPVLGLFYTAWRLK
jgi:L-asparagine transporter-like permease